MNKKKLITAGIAVLILIIAAAVIGIVTYDHGGSKYNGELYFLNESSTAIEAESREIRYKDMQSLAEGVIDELMKGPDNSKHRRIIERKTKLLSLEGVETDNLAANFSREFLTGDNQKDILAVYAVVKSLCAISTVNSVKVVIEGKDITSADGSIIGYLTDQDINLPTDTVSSEMREITLYFPPKSEYTLKKEVRTIRVNDQQPLAQYIINELIKGPQAEGLGEALSKDTVLLSVETSNNICFVNFRANFLDKNSGSAEKEKMIVFSIVDSLTELDAIDRVQFLMDGKRVQNFGNINIFGMFGRDESMIE